MIHHLRGIHHVQAVPGTYPERNTMKFRGYNQLLLVVFIAVQGMIMAAMARPSFAAMNEMCDEELNQVTGSGFSSFTLTPGPGPSESVARAYFQIVTRTYTEIESLKMGYYNDGSPLAWDQDWTNVSFGTPETDLIVNGVYIEASFTNISDPANRTLNYIRVGTPSMTGTISAEFNSFSGQIKDTGGSDLVNKHRVSLGSATITCTDSAFSASLNTGGPEKGWWMYFDNASITYH